MAITEARRSQLDGIVQDMIRNKESDSNVQFVVDDFKKKYENEGQVVPQASTAKSGNSLDRNKILSAGVEVAKGVSKGVLSTLSGAAELGQKGLESTFKTILPKRAEDALQLNNPVLKNSAKHLQSQAEKNLGLEEKSLTTPQNKAQTVGKFLEQAAEFLVPGSVGVKLAKIKGGAGLVAGTARLGLTAFGEGASAAGVTALQTGGDGKETKQAFTIGSLIPVGAKLMSVPLRALVEKLPSTLVRAAIGQGKKELLAGKDVANYVLTNKRIGTAQQLISKSAGEIDLLNNNIASNLKSVSVIKNKITNKSIFENVANKLNEEGGQITTEEVKDIIYQLAPQSKGLLSKPSMGLVTGNKLRQSIDRTLGDKAFLGGQLPFNKDVLKKFNSVLREEVKIKAPEGTRGLFDDLSKEITLRDSLLNKYTNSKSPVSLVDVMSALVGSVGGIPGAIGGVAIKKAANSPLTQTLAAQGLSKLGELEPVLKKLAPAERALILELIQKK